MFASGWYLNWWLAAMFLVGIASLVVALLAGRFRRRPRRVVRLVALVTGVGLLTAWIATDLAGPGPSLGGSPFPWSVVPETFVYENEVWGGGYGTPDPRKAPCVSREHLSTEGVPGASARVRERPFDDGHLAGLFGGPAIFVAGGDDPEHPRWFFLEMGHDCFIVFPRFQGGQG